MWPGQPAGHRRLWAMVDRGPDLSRLENVLSDLRGEGGLHTLFHSGAPDYDTKTAPTLSGSEFRNRASK